MLNKFKGIKEKQSKKKRQPEIKRHITDGLFHPENSEIVSQGSHAVRRHTMTNGLKELVTDSESSSDGDDQQLAYKRSRNPQIAEIKNKKIPVHTFTLEDQEFDYWQGHYFQRVNTLGKGSTFGDKALVEAN